MAGTVYTPNVAVTVNGTPVQPIKARVESSFADPVSRGYAEFRTAPTWGHGDTLDITMGAGTNNVQRFVGSILQGDYTNSGPTVTLVGRGSLHTVQKYRNEAPKGLGLIDLTGGPATDEDIITAVLDLVGVGYSGIGGTGIIRGASAPDDFRWRYGESALEYIQRIDKASLGYRIIESIGGTIFRAQVYGRPRGSSDYTFTEGVDIFEGGHAQRSTFERYQAVTVNGFDYGDGLGPVSYSSGSGTPYAFSSAMIESIDDTDSRGGVSAQAMADYLLAELDRETVRVSGFSTPRDDLIGPGQTHSVVAPLLGTTEPLWVLGVTVEIDEDNFTQTMEYVGGGLAEGGYEGP